jgi:hypothetical protein
MLINGLCYQKDGKTLAGADTDDSANYLHGI